MFLFCTKEADQATATSGIRWEGICVQNEIYYKTKQIVRRYVSKSTELEKKIKKYQTFLPLLESANKMKTGKTQSVLAGWQK